MLTKIAKIIKKYREDVFADIEGITWTPKFSRHEEISFIFDKINKLDLAFEYWGYDSDLYEDSVYYEKGWKNSAKDEFLRIWHIEYPEESYYNYAGLGIASDVPY